MSLEGKLFGKEWNVSSKSTVDAFSDIDGVEDFLFEI